MSWSLRAILTDLRSMFLRGDDFFMAKPKQKALPGMEDREIRELREAALEYADARDSRIAAAENEAGLRDGLLKLMKKHKKQTYRYHGISLELVTEEKVKVKIEGRDKESQA